MVEFTRSDPRGAEACWLPLLCILVALPMCKSSGEETKTMDPNLQDFHRGEPVELEHAARPVRDTPAPPVATGGEGAKPGIVRSHANARLNGRSETEVVVGPWHAAWTVPLPPSMTPEAALAVGDRIVVQARGSWSLHDRTGRSLGVFARVAGDVAIDPASNLLFYGDDSGFLSAARLDTGSVDSIIEIRSGGSAYSCTLLWRRGRELAVHGFEQPQMSHDALPEVEHTQLEVIDLGEPLAKDDIAFVTSSRRVAGMSSRVVPFLVAAASRGVMMAVPGHVYGADEHLEVKDDLTANFEPVAMSLDELDRAHLVVNAGRSPALWILDVAAGERYVNAPLSGEPLTLPPIIGYDHRVFVLLRNGVVALEHDGSVAFTVPTASPPTGAAITRNGILVLSVGSQVQLIGPDGHRQVAFDLGEPLATAPVLLSGTALLVASASRLIEARYGP